jgi:hypothetical protein
MSHYGATEGRQGMALQVAEKFARRDCGLFQASLFSR